MNIVIRKEKETEYRIVEEITREAFWNLYFPGCDEHYTTHILRNHPDFIKELSFVAELDNKIIGNIMYTKSYVIDEDQHKIETISFGPICVLPKYQNIDWTNKDNYNLNNNIHPSRKNSFYGYSINPYDVIFHKWFWGNPNTVNYEIIKQYGDI